MKTEQLRSRVDRIEKQRGGGRRAVFALISSPAGRVDDASEIDEAIKRDIPAEIREQASSISTIYTGVPRSGDGPNPRVSKWWIWNEETK